MVPARSIDWMRSMTIGNSTPDWRAIWPSGSRWNPWILSSETARICALIGSVREAGALPDDVVGVVTFILSGTGSLRDGDEKYQIGKSLRADFEAGLLERGSRCTPVFFANKWFMWL